MAWPSVSLLQSVTGTACPTPPAGSGFCNQVWFWGHLWVPGLGTEGYGPTEHPVSRASGWALKMELLSLEMECSGAGSWRALLERHFVEFYLLDVPY